MTATIETTSTPVAATTIALRRGVLPVRGRTGASELAGEADAGAGGGGGGAAFDTGFGVEAAASVGCRCVVGVARFFAADVAAPGFDFFGPVDDVRFVETFGARAGFLPASADTSSVQRTA